MAVHSSGPNTGETARNSAATPRSRLSSSTFWTASTTIPWYQTATITPAASERARVLTPLGTLNAAGTIQRISAIGSSTRASAR